MIDPALLLVAHGTRNPRGVEMIASLADAVSRDVGATRVAFVDVLGPSPAEVLRDSGRPTVLVPAFLASGYHVHADVPREVADSGHPAVAVTRALGPDPVLARVLLHRLSAAGWKPGDAVVLAAAGSSDPRALGDARVPDVVAGLRAAGARRVFVASYLLADGLFHARLADAGADGVAAPLGVHDSIVRLVAERYRSAATALLAGGPLRG